MSIALTGVEVRHGYGIRLVFSNTLAAGAFGILPTIYSVTPVDGRGTSTLVKAAMSVTGSSTNVELALGTELVRDAPYLVSAVGVPATDLSVTPAGSELTFVYASDLKKKNTEGVVSNRQLILYKRDIVWNGVDFQEGPNGDLDTISGPANVAKALHRGLESSGRKWDDSWGAKINEFIDSPSGLAGNVRGRAIAQCLRDPRVQSVRVTFSVKDDSTFVFVDPILISGEPAQRVTLTVPNQ